MPEFHQKVSLPVFSSLNFAPFYQKWKYLRLYRIDKGKPIVPNCLKVCSRCVKTRRATKSGFTLMEIMIVVLILGILLNVAVPNFSRARDVARHKKCVANLRQINCAKIQWAFENLKGASDTPLPADLFGPTAYVQTAPHCPSTNADYVLGTVADNPACPTPAPLEASCTTVCHKKTPT